MNKNTHSLKKEMKKKEETSKLEEKNPICFTIMPFGGWFDKYYFKVYVPAIEKAGFEAKRADDIYRPGNIVNDIWRFTNEAKIILADLTNKNPNVLYELGLAHAITKPAILVTASIDDVPFDLRSLRVIEYDKNFPDWGEILQSKIAKALKETIESPEDAIPPTFLEVNKSKSMEVSDERKDFMQLKHDIDLIKKKIRPSNMISSFPTHMEINLDQALSLVREWFRNGLPIKEISRRLKDKGLFLGEIDYVLSQYAKGL